MLANVQVEATRFAQVYWDLLREQWRYQRGLFCLAAGAGAVSAFGHGLTILVLVYAVRVMDPNRSAESIFPETWPAEAVLAIFAVFLLIIGVINAWLSWKSVLWSRQAGRRYHEILTEEMLEGLADARAGDLGEVPEDFVRNPGRPFVQGPLISGIATETVLGAVQSVTLVVVFFVFLCSVDWKFVLLVVPFILLPLPSLLFLNRKTHSVSRRFYGKERAAANSELTGLVREANKGQLDTGSLVLSRYRDSENIRMALDDYDFFKVAEQKGRYVLNFLQSVLSTLGLLALGYAALQGWLSWSVIIAGLLAVLRFQQGLAGIFGAVTNLVRFSPVVARLAEFRSALAAGRVGGTDEEREPSPAPSFSAGSGADPEGVSLVVTALGFQKTSIPSLRSALTTARKPPFRPGEPLFALFSGVTGDGEAGGRSSWDARLSQLEASDESENEVSVFEAPTAFLADEDADRLRNRRFRRVVVVASQWTGTLEGFDYVYRISEDGSIKEGEPEDWQDRMEELARKDTSSAVEAAGLEDMLA